MEDLSVVLKRTLLQDLYKKKGGAFSSVEQRMVKMNEERRTLRHDTAFERRRIPENLTPLVTPAAVKHKKTSQDTNRPVNKRLEMLEKWKADKQKRKQEQQKHTKPLFKVTHVPVEIGLPKLDNVNREIKGKPIKSKFAPPNHRFKPPANVKPIVFIANENGNMEERQMVTRSQARSLVNPNFKDNAVKKKEVKNKKSTKEKTTEDKMAGPGQKKPTKSEHNESMSPDYPIAQIKTPVREPPVYISPFVTISRGKESARKEYEARKLGKSFSEDKDLLNSTSPKAGAAYFEWRLNNQISRLQELCEQWNKYKVEENPPEEAISVIDVAIGQTNLLITKKFAQFRSLIEMCQNGNAETSVTCEDLHGFWDMIYIQVNNLDQRFENLQKLRSNNWEEFVHDVKKVVKKRGRPLKTAKASAALKQAIQAARRKKQETGDNTEDEKCIEKTPQNRTSSHTLRMKSAEVSHRNSSPGLMMMKVAQFAKVVDTPSRSILKGVAPKSVKSQTKTVLFQDETTDHMDDIENDLNNLNLQSKGKTPTRRSIRLSKSKLF